MILIENSLFLCSHQLAYLINASCSCGIWNSCPGWRNWDLPELVPVEVCPLTCPVLLGTMVGMATGELIISTWPSGNKLDWGSKELDTNGGWKNPCGVTSPVWSHLLPPLPDRFSNCSTWVVAKSGERKTGPPDRVPVEQNICGLVIQSHRSLRFLDSRSASTFCWPGKCSETKNKFLWMHHSRKARASSHKSLEWVPPIRLMKVTAVILSSLRRMIMLLSAFRKHCTARNAARNAARSSR